MRNQAANTGKPPYSASLYTRTFLPFNSILMGLLVMAFSSMLHADMPEESNMTSSSENNKSHPCIVILGASYAKSWKIDQLMGCSILNAGIDGNQSFEMLARFQEDVINHKPDYVILWGFINDIFRSDPGRLKETISRIKTSYVDMIELARKHDIEPVLATEVTIREPSGFKNSILKILGDLMGKTSYQSSINQQVQETNIWLRELAEQENLRLLDLEQALADTDGRRLKAYAKEDGSHITEAAYRAISDTARRELNN